MIITAGLFVVFYGAKVEWMRRSGVIGRGMALALLQWFLSV